MNLIKRHIEITEARTTITEQQVYVPEIREDTLKIKGSAVSTVYHSLNNLIHPVLSEQEKGDIQAHAS